MKGQQLPLSVQLSQTAEFINFFPGPNDDVLEAVRRFATGEGGGAILLFGAPRSGKTHLLRAASNACGERGRYRSMRSGEIDGSAAATADELVCIDDVDAVCGQHEAELALLRLIDRLRANDTRLLLAAAAAPSRLPLQLPDLRTRLSAAAILGLKPLRDEDRRVLLQQSARNRGLELPDEVSGWLLNRVERDAGSLLAALDRLDHAALSAQRRLTLPFVQQILSA